MPMISVSQNSVASVNWPAPPCGVWCGSANIRASLINSLTRHVRSLIVTNNGSTDTSILGENMNRILSRSRMILLALAPVLSLTLNAAETAKPNIIVFLADDQGWGDLSVNGNRQLNTPQID